MLHYNGTAVFSHPLERVGPLRRALQPNFFTTINATTVQCRTTRTCISVITVDYCRALEGMAKLTKSSQEEAYHMSCTAGLALTRTLCSPSLIEANYLVRYNDSRKNTCVQNK